MADSITLPFINIEALAYRNLVQTHLLKAISAVWKDSVKEFALRGAIASSVDTGMAAATFSVASEKAKDFQGADATFDIVLGKQKRSSAKPLLTPEGGLIRNRARFITSGISAARKATKVKFGSDRTPEWEFSFDIRVWQLKHVVEPKTQAFTKAKAAFWEFFLNNFKEYTQRALSVPKIIVKQETFHG